jgi:hypothetical protein
VAHRSYNIDLRWRTDMSRSDYTDNLDHWDLVRWRGAVVAATRGVRGQTLLRDLLAALDSLPEKRLIRNELVTSSGEVCALGALARVRELPVFDIDPDDYEAVAEVFGVAPALVREIEAENDCWDKSPENRWARMRAWVSAQIKQ